MNVPISKAVGDKIVRLDDDVVALIALDLHQLGLLEASGFTKWRNYLTATNLYDRHWLLAYEALEQGWLHHATATTTLELMNSFRFCVNTEFASTAPEPRQQPASSGTRRMKRLMRQRSRSGSYHQISQRSRDRRERKGQLLRNLAAGLCTGNFRKFRYTPRDSPNSKSTHLQCQPLALSPHAHRGARTPAKFTKW